MSLIRNLRDRRLVQIVVAYLAGGWIALEAISQIVEHGVLPHIFYTLGLAWYLAGIVAAAIIGWFHGERGAQKAPLIEVLLLGILGTAVVGFSGNVTWRQYQRHQAVLGAAEGGLDPRRVAVLYFRDITRGGELQYLADGLTEGLTGELATVRALDVVSPNGVLPYRNGSEPVEVVAGALKAGTVVDGTVERSGDEARLNLRIHDGASGAEFRRATLTRSLADPLGLRDDLVEEASRFLREWLGAEIRLRRQERETSEPRAWSLVQQAEQAFKEARSAHAAAQVDVAERQFNRADSLLAVAEAVDPAWLEPIIERARVAYRRSRLGFDLHQDPEAILEPIQTALFHAERVLDRNPTHAEGLEVRGTVRYWLWHMGRFRPRVSPEEQERLFLDARQDLERAVEADPSRATAYVTLSHLYLNCDDRTQSSVALAARRAYEEDAYLETASVVLQRMVDAYSSLQQFADARQWCEEGALRFPDEPAFTECRLMLMLAPGGSPDPDSARSLVRRLDALAATEEQRAWTEVWCGVMQAGVLARAGRMDSARTILDGAHEAQRRIADDLDPRLDLLSLEAYVRHLIGEDERAIELLQRYAAVNPGHSFDPAGGLYWWWQELAHHPKYQQLVVLRPAGR